MKAIEHSNDLVVWKRWIGPGPDDDIMKLWLGDVATFIEEEQPYGFFRVVEWTFVPVSCDNAGVTSTER